jgi:HTH-type transcriptional regulator / antitoxin HigA
MNMLASRNIPEMAKVWANFQREVGLRKISTQADYLHVRQLADFLADEVGDDEGHDLYAMFELAMELLEHWEKKHVEMPNAEPKEVLRFLLDQHNLKQKDLESEGIASQSLISDVLAGRRTISKRLAKSLAERFHVEFSAFL